VPVRCFLLFLCFKNVTQEIFSELDETKARRPYFTEFPDYRRGDEAEPEGGHTIGRRGLGLARAPGCVGPLVHL
jgi:hypothetical protein